MLQDFASCHGFELQLIDQVMFSDLRHFGDRSGNPGNLRTFIRPIEELISLTRQLLGPQCCQYVVCTLYTYSIGPIRLQTLRVSIAF